MMAIPTSLHGWAWRKAAWAVEDLEQDIRTVYSVLGHKGILSLEGMSPGVADEVERFISE